MSSYLLLIYVYLQFLIICMIFVFLELKNIFALKTSRKA